MKFIATALLVLVVDPVFAQTRTVPAASDISITRSGTQTSRAGPSENFTGKVKVDPLFQTKPPARGGGSYVTFEPGARSAWHTHPLGQTLVVTTGVGRVQQWGGAANEIRPGDVVWIPAGQKHWHGAAPDSAMTHIAISESLNGKTVDWMEKVSDSQYLAPVAGLAKPAEAGPTRAQQLMGDFAPKLADLTDKVLFGDVWERADLAKRDRSLVTVSALIAMDRPDQLRSHLARARDNGVTEAEVVETITHLAFYAGWPSAVSAVGVAREVFQKK